MRSVTLLQIGLGVMTVIFAFIVGIVLVIPSAIGVEGNQYQLGVPHSPWHRTQKRKKSLESSDFLSSIGEPNFNGTQLN
jgi:hypothetical protein